MSVLRKLGKDDESLRKAVVGFKPREGQPVGLWQIPGVWNVWSPGPEVGTWWLLPGDAEARETYAELAQSLDAGSPVVKQVASGAIAVRTQEARSLSTLGKKA